MKLCGTLVAIMVAAWCAAAAQPPDQIEPEDVVAHFEVLGTTCELPDQALPWINGYYFTPCQLGFACEDDRAMACFHGWIGNGRLYDSQFFPRAWNQDRLESPLALYYRKATSDDSPTVWVYGVDLERNMLVNSRVFESDTSICRGCSFEGWHIIHPGPGYTKVNFDLKGSPFGGPNPEGRRLVGYDIIDPAGECKHKLEPGSRWRAFRIDRRLSLDADRVWIVVAYYSDAYEWDLAGRSDIDRPGYSGCEECIKHNIFHPSCRDCWKQLPVEKVVSVRSRVTLERDLCRFLPDLYMCLTDELVPDFGKGLLLEFEDVKDFSLYVLDSHSSTAIAGAEAVKGESASIHITPAMLIRARGLQNMALALIAPEDVERAEREVQVKIIPYQE
ncbi:hypothetical protein KQH82_07655 [bacterium]|nr:hypothetical protein [bacterium]